MKSKDVLGGLALAVALQLGMLAGSAQTNIYLFTGSETNITLPPGTYIITAYGAAGGLSSKHVYPYSGGLGAEMGAEFNFSSPTDLTLLVGGLGGYGQPANGQTLIVAGGGGGGSFVVEGSTPLVVAGGGGGGAANGGAANGGNATITPYGSTGGGNDGGSGGTGNNGGNGGGYLIFGGVAAFASGAGGGGGFNTDGGFGNATYDGAYPVGGSSFEDGGVGAFGNGLNFAGGGFGGGGDGYSDASDAFGGGGGGCRLPPVLFWCRWRGRLVHRLICHGDSRRGFRHHQHGLPIQPIPRRNYYYRNSSTPCHRHHQRSLWFRGRRVWIQRHRPGRLERGHSGQLGPANLDAAANQSARQRPALFHRSAVHHQHPALLPRAIIAVNKKAFI